MKENCCDCFKRIWSCLTGPHPQGFGTLLIGVAALVALLQGTSLLDRVLQIQEQAKQIASAVTELKKQSQQISSALDLLGTQLKELKATQTVASSPALNETNSTKEQIGQAVRQSFSEKPTAGQSSIYLPESKLDQTIDKLYQAKSPSERTVILQNSLEYQPGTLLNENGQPLKTEQGDPLKLEKSGLPTSQVPNQ